MLSWRGQAREQTLLPVIWIHPEHGAVTRSKPGTSCRDVKQIGIRRTVNQWLRRNNCEREAAHEMRENLWDAKSSPGSLERRRGDPSQHEARREFCVRWHGDCGTLGETDGG